MNYWITAILFAVPLQLVGSDQDTVINIGHGRCRTKWTVPERRVEFYTVREQCRYYERCSFKTSTKSRTKIVDKEMHTDFCCPGYTNVGSTWQLICNPNCEPMCVNGECIAPGNCSCNEGYGKAPSSNHICEHRCVPECVNATCVGVNICDCYAGFFVEDPGAKHVCSPRCTFGCLHGDCTAPETCTCHPGYALSSNHSTCEPVCTLECKYGYCSGPNKCTCYDNYVETPYWDVCHPYCSEPCINGQCTSPEECTCWDGYFAISNSTCAPNCSKPCQNGECIAPELCSCNEGYEKDDNETCIPICSLGCENGTCVSPDNCVCSDGHYYSNGTCLPWCADGCTNGNCTGPTECTCDPSTFRTSQSHCAPRCFDKSICLEHSTLCNQRPVETCCSLGLNELDNAVAVYCAPIKDVRYREIPMCDDSVSIPGYQSMDLIGQFGDLNITNETLTLAIALTTPHYYDDVTELCYLQLCTQSSFHFMKGLTYISCYSGGEDGKYHPEYSNTSQGVSATAVASLLIILLVMAVAAAVYSYIRRVRKISYTVNSEVISERLYQEQEVNVEDEL